MLMCQCLAILGGLGALALAPSREGAMLLVPLSGDMASAANIALDGHARLLGKGRLPGSLVVWGGRAGAGALLGEGVIAIAASPALCGDAARAELVG